MAVKMLPVNHNDTQQKAQLLYRHKSTATVVTIRIDQPLLGVFV